MNVRVLAVLVYVCFHHCVVIKHVCLRTTYLSHLLSIYRPNFLPVVSSRELESQGGTRMSRSRESKEGIKWRE